MTDVNNAAGGAASEAAADSASAVARFIANWGPSGGAERANFPSFARDLCDLIAVPHPEPTLPDVSQNAYVFERDVTFQNLDGSTSVGRIDLYKRGCFVLEAKQGTEKPDAADDHQREKLWALWTEPLSLDPSRRLSP